jgi:hypothetical protein
MRHLESGISRKLFDEMIQFYASDLAAAFDDRYSGLFIAKYDGPEDAASIELRSMFGTVVFRWDSYAAALAGLEVIIRDHFGISEPNSMPGDDIERLV